MNEPAQVEMFDITVFDDETVEYLRESEAFINERRRLAGTAIVEIGQRLDAVRDWLGEDEGFLAWIASAFEWKKSTAYNFMNVARAFPNFGSDLALIEPSALYLVSAPKAPEPAREAVKETAAEGRKVSHSQAKAAVGAAKDAKDKGASSAAQKEAAKDAARLPTPSQARKLAKETGRPVAASDGKLHTGISAKEEREDAALTARIYAYVNPIRAIAEAKQEPEAWLAELPKYMRKTVNKHLGRAHDRLNRLMEMWTHDEQRQVGRRHRDRGQGASSRAA
jgi:hypothetical protein